MTEAEWLSCTDPMPMLEFLAEKMSERKLRLFSVAVARLFGARMNADLREAIDTGERLADALATKEEQLHQVRKLYDVYTLGFPDDNLARLAAITTVAVWKSNTSVLRGAGWNMTRQATAAKQPDLLREIFNPFHPITLNSDWLTPGVVTLAQGIYSEKAFDRMPILADALQDAGCDNEAMLQHCRDERVHVRGCWVLDLVTGRK